VSSLRSTTLRTDVVEPVEVVVVVRFL